MEAFWRSLRSSWRWECCLSRTRILKERSWFRRIPGSYLHMTQTLFNTHCCNICSWMPESQLSPWEELSCASYTGEMAVELVLWRRGACLHNQSNCKTSPKGKRYCLTCSQLRASRSFADIAFHSWSRYHHCLLRSLVCRWGWSPKARNISSDYICFYFH